MIPLKNESGVHIGFRLKSLKENGNEKLEYNKAEKQIELGEVIELKIVYHKHILIPVKFESEKGLYKEAWLIFDTGTFVPLIITDNEFKKSLGTTNSIKVDGFKINNPVFGEFSIPEGIKYYNDVYTSEIPEKLKGKPIVGLMGYNLFRNYLVSIDISNEKIYLKNADNKKRTLGDKLTSIKVEYRNEQDNIWIPVKINNKEGFAHIDTGYPLTWVEKTKVKNKISQFKIGRFKTGISDKIKFKKLDQKQNYKSLPFKLIANIGNNFLEHFVVTIDSKNKMLFFESIEK